MTFLLSLKRLKLKLNKLCSKEYFIIFHQKEERGKLQATMILCHIASRGGACFNFSTPEGRGRGREELSECEANLANQGQIVRHYLKKKKKVKNLLGRSHTYHILQESLTSLVCQVYSCEKETSIDLEIIWWPVL